MIAKTNYIGLDYFKLVAAILVIAIHTGPLLSYSEYADFLVTSILARIAVPFFFMAAGFFLFRKLQDKPDQTRKTLKSYLFKILLIYIISILIYVPLNLYAGHYAEGFSLSSLLGDLIFNGTFYHLWFLPALIIGVYVVYMLSRMLPVAYVLVITGLLYLVGLLGDSYYGFVEQAPIMNTVYSYLFSIFDYTRNGLLFAPVFVALGLLAARRTEQRQSHSTYAIYLAIALVLLFLEGHFVLGYELSRHDSMYVFLLPAVYVIFRCLLLLRGSSSVYIRHASLWIYLLHPMVIVLVRGVADWMGLESILITNSLVHYVAVTLLSMILAAVVVRVRYNYRSNHNPSRSRAWKEIDLTHLEHNLSELKRVLPSTSIIMAVVKADAYGHGSIEIARYLNKAGVNYYAVAEISEGIILRRRGVKGNILVIGETCESRLDELVKYKLQQTVISAEYGECLNAFGRKVDVHVKIDTGMNRLGTCYNDVERLGSIYRLKNLRIVGTYSHLAMSDSLEAVDVAYSHEQIQRFNQIVENLKEEGIDPGILHIQSSYGIMNYPEMRYDMARPGIALYGLLSNRAEVKSHLDLRPVLSLRARVVYVKNVCGNKPIGYGHNCLTTQDSRIATISIGYADGIPRALSDNGGHVIIRGQRAPIMGRICMDHLMVDVTGIAGVERGDIATLIGQDGESTITAEELAEQCGTITNEILSRIGNRVERVYR